jgi:hypothetical protein
MSARGSTRSVALALALGLLTSSGGAADHDNLEHGQPTTLADAYAAKYLERQLHAIASYRRTEEGRDLMVFEPRFELGFPRNAQLSLGAPLQLVDFDELDLGRFAADGFYNLNQETLALPALALGAGVEAPTGEGQHGFDPYFQAYLSKLVPGSSYWHGIHLNGMLQLNADRREEERSSRYRVVLGYAFRISASLIGIVDGVREQKMKEGVTEHRAELGFRYQVTPLLVATLGGGAGAADDAAVGRANVGLQYYAF